MSETKVGELNKVQHDTIVGAIEKMETGMPADLDMAKVMLTSLLPSEEQGPVWPRWVHHPEDKQPSKEAANEEEETKILSEWGVLPKGEPKPSPPPMQRASERDKR